MWGVARLERLLYAVFLQAPPPPYPHAVGFFWALSPLLCANAMALCAPVPFGEHRGRRGWVGRGRALRLWVGVWAGAVLLACNRT